MIEPRKSRRHRLDLGVETIVGDGPVDIPVLLGPRPVEVVRDEEDLERPAAADQPRKPGRRTAAGHDTRADFEVTDQRVLARGEAQVAGEYELAAGATTRPRIAAMLTTGARDSRTIRSSHGCMPGRTGR